VSEPAPPEWLDALAARLPSVRASHLEAATPPPHGGPRSAVLVLFGRQPALGNDVLLTQRSAGLRSHPGQVAFPGGRLDPDDAGPVGAALREAREETGLDDSGVQVLGLLPDLFLPPSGFVVTPVLAWWSRPTPVAAVDPLEVARVERVPLAELLDPANRFRVRHPSGYVGPGFSASGLFVWGFTAGLLSRLLALAGLEQPWDTSLVRPVPDLAVERRT
jgi:8-oxo-dGTP pyrophosphatase MutT (NUDIX family)